MKLATTLAFVSIASVVLLTACGGGRVVVAQQPTPAPAAFAPAPAPSSVVVTTVPATPAPPVVSTVIEPSPGPDYIRVEGYYNWLGTAMCGCPRRGQGFLARVRPMCRDTGSPRLQGTFGCRAPGSRSWPA